MQTFDPLNKTLEDERRKTSLADRSHLRARRRSTGTVMPAVRIVNLRDGS